MRLSPYTSRLAQGWCIERQTPRSVAGECICCVLGGAQTSWVPACTRSAVGGAAAAAATGRLLRPVWHALLQSMELQSRMRCCQAGGKAEQRRGKVGRRARATSGRGCNEARRGRVLEFCEHSAGPCKCAGEWRRRWRRRRSWRACCDVASPPASAPHPAGHNSRRFTGARSRTARAVDQVLRSVCQVGIQRVSQVLSNVERGTTNGRAQCKPCFALCPLRQRAELAAAGRAVGGRRGRAGRQPLLLVLNRQERAVRAAAGGRGRGGG